MGGIHLPAATLLMIEKLEELVARQVEAISNLQIDKITVWDSGGNGDGSSTSNFISNLFKSLPPLQDISEMAGFELPEYLGNLKGKEKLTEEPIAEEAPASTEIVEDVSLNKSCPFWEFSRLGTGIGVLF